MPDQHRHDHEHAGGAHPTTFQGKVAEAIPRSFDKPQPETSSLPVYEPDIENPPPPGLPFIPFPIWNDLAEPDSDWETMERERVGSRDLMGNTAAMRAAGERHLPKWQGRTEEETESEWQYDRRLLMAVLHNHYGTSIRSTLEQAFSKSLTLKDFPDELLALETMIGKDRSSFDSFAKLTAGNSLAETISHTLISMPPKPKDVSPEEDKKRQPFWFNIPARQLIATNSIDAEDGRETLQNARRLYNGKTQVDQGYGMTNARRVQIFQRGNPMLAESLERPELGFSSSVVVEETIGAGGKLMWTPLFETFGHFTPPPGATEAITAMFREIPLVPTYTVKTGHFRGDLALGNLKDLQLAHWRKNAEKDNGLSVAGVPAKFFKGFTADQVKGLPWGPFMAVYHPAAGDADPAIEDIAHSLNAMDMMQDDLKELQAAMAIIALEPSVSKATGDEKATIRQIDEARQLTRKEAWLMTWLESFFQSWVWTAAYLNIELNPELCVSCSQEVFDALRGNQGFDFIVDIASTLESSNSAEIDRFILDEGKRHALISEGFDIDDYIAKRTLERAAALTRSV